MQLSPHPKPIPLHHPAAALLPLAVDRFSRIPLYEQLCRQLRQAIHEGQLDTTVTLPPEPELASQLGVSRFTLRQALDQLVREGLLRRQRGRGTFVIGISPRPERRGRRWRSAPAASIEVVRFGPTLPTLDVSEALELDPSDPIVEIVRRHWVGGHPAGLDRIYLEARLLPNLSAADLQGFSLYHVIEQRAGVLLTGAAETVHARQLDDESARLLGIGPGEPALEVERHTYAGRRVIELRQTVVPSTSEAFEIHLSRADLCTDSLPRRAHVNGIESRA